MVPFRSIREVEAWWQTTCKRVQVSVLIDWGPELGVQRREIRRMGNSWVVGFSDPNPRRLRLAPNQPSGKGYTHGR